MKKVWKVWKVWAAFGAVFVMSAAFTCWVYGGPDVWPLPVMGEAESKEGSVIVIDPGHGGADGGSCGRSGVMEKDINLAIGLELAERLQDYKAKVVMTRTEDKRLSDDEPGAARKHRRDLEMRKEVIEGAGADIAVSIHLNSFPQDESVCGAQVFYPKEHEMGTSVQAVERLSGKFAEAVQKALEINIDDGRQRKVMTKNDVFLMKNMETDIILVECGFLSNPKEEELLQTAEYQQLVSKAIFEGLDEILCLEKREKLPVIDSTNKIT